MNAKYFFIIFVFAQFLPSDALSFFDFFELWRKYRGIAGIVFLLSKIMYKFIKKRFFVCISTVRTVILRRVLPMAGPGQAPYYAFYNSNGVLGNISNSIDYSIYPWVQEILPACACVLSPGELISFSYTNYK